MGEDNASNASPKVAVALEYDRSKAAVPRVVASGQGSLAERIVAAALEHGVPLREDADLATMLSVLDDACEIPPEALVAVAEILVHVYRANRDLAVSRLGHPLPTS
ncbi:MAG: EscU/YscU/HrcU family type III secretion system export apparatus switch protein [Alphaproteobacteria bacterium]|nr:MAG: EscU/YscU/HrcU family type III secretion system export apparatus switch protein [Alphaproteobacteria bacterium]